MMESVKQARLEALGFKVGTAQEFLISSYHGE